MTRRCRLTTRTWRCFDGPAADPEVITGPGVIGLYPEMYPGAPSFHYVSCTRITHATGHMEGSFRFRFLDGAQEEVDVEVGRFVVFGSRFAIRIPSNLSSTVLPVSLLFVACVRIRIPS